MTIAVTILGSTGTIGVNTLDVIAQHPEGFSVFALSANSNVEGLFGQCQTWNPPIAVMVEERAASQLELRCKKAGLDTQVLAGTAALATVAAHEQVEIGRAHV